jgi:hypothetical protein
MKNNFLIVLIILLNACNSSNDKFKLCSNEKHPYYYPTLNYEGGFYEIKKHYYDKYKNIQSDKNTGIIRIQFQVNCRGETGNYKIASYSLDYKLETINKQINDQLLLLTKDLKDWIPAVDDKGESIDSHKFFAFKVINGKLVDILPK